MSPKDYSNAFNDAQREIRYAYSGLNRKRQIINAVVNNLHNTQMEMIEDAVAIKESAGFPEANEVINYIRAL